MEGKLREVKSLESGAGRWLGGIAEEWEGTGEGSGERTGEGPSLPPMRFPLK